MKKVLLLADDDIDDRELFCEALQSIDPAIICYLASDGKEVFQILSNNELDKCLSHLKETSEYRDIPVLIYSTSVRQRDAKMAIELGALCAFEKPNSFSELKNILKVVVDNIDNKLLDAARNFQHIKSQKIFSC